MKEVMHLKKICDIIEKDNDYAGKEYIVQMKRNRSRNRIGQWLFVLAASVATMFVVPWLLRSPESVSEVVISVSSIIVTVILGIATYRQTAIQNEIDMWDKTPYVRLELEIIDVAQLLREIQLKKLIKSMKEETEITQEDECEDAIIPEFELYENKKYISYTDCVGKNIMMPLVVKNAGKITIKRMKHFFYKGDFRTKEARWSRCSDSGRALIAYRDYKDKTSVLGELNPFTFSNVGIIEGEEVKLDVDIGKNLKDILAEKDEIVTYSFAFEIESIYGDIYTQYIMIKVYFAGLVKDVIKAQVVDQDVEIKLGKFRGKVIE